MLHGRNLHVTDAVEKSAGKPRTVKFTVDWPRLSVQVASSRTTCPDMYSDPQLALPVPCSPNSPPFCPVPAFPDTCTYQEDV